MISQQSRLVQAPGGQGDTGGPEPIFLSCQVTQGPEPRCKSGLSPGCVPAPPHLYPEGQLFCVFNGHDHTCLLGLGCDLN